MINILLIVFITLSAWSKVSLEFIPEESSVRQGEIIAGTLILKESEGQVSLPVLQGRNLSKTLYILSSSAFKEQEGKLQSQVKAIFLVVPSGKELVEVIKGDEVHVHWNDLEIIPTKGGKSFLLGEFEIPERMKIFQWIMLLSILVIIGLSLNLYLRKNRSKKTIIETKKKYKTEILNCSEYDDVVKMWQQKLKYLEKFPELDPMFKNLEQVLFKYQFKISRNDAEIQEVMRAYANFKLDVSGVLNGI